MLKWTNIVRLFCVLSNRELSYYRFHWVSLFALVQSKIRPIFRTFHFARCLKYKFYLALVLFMLYWTTTNKLSWFRSFVCSFIQSFVQSLVNRSFILLSMAHLQLCSSVSLSSFIYLFVGSLLDLPVSIPRFYFLSAPASPLCLVACNFSRYMASHRSFSLHSTQVPLRILFCTLSLQNRWYILKGYLRLRNLHPLFLYRNLKK